MAPAIELIGISSWSTYPDRHRRLPEEKGAKTNNAKLSTTKTNDITGCCTTCDGHVHSAKEAGNGFLAIQ